MAKVAKREDSAHTKSAILDAAEKLFADQGFDGAGIMEIAKTANVPKSLIYYYFESKEEILKELLNRFIQNVIKMNYEMAEGFEPPETLTKDGIVKMLQYGYQFFTDRYKMFKIIFQESLKNVFIENFLLNIQISQDESIDYFKKAGMEVDEKDLKLGHFFLIAMPFMMFTLHKDKWCEMNDYDPDEAREKFIDLLGDISTLVMSRAVKQID